MGTRAFQGEAVTPTAFAGVVGPSPHWLLVEAIFSFRCSAGRADDPTKTSALLLRTRSSAGIRGQLVPEGSRSPENEINSSRAVREVRKSRSTRLEAFARSAKRAQLISRRSRGPEDEITSSRGVREVLNARAARFGGVRMPSGGIRPCLLARAVQRGGCLLEPSRDTVAWGESVLRGRGPGARPTEVRRLFLATPWRNRGPDGARGSGLNCTFVAESRRPEGRGGSVVNRHNPWRQQVRRSAALMPWAWLALSGCGRLGYAEVFPDASSDPGLDASIEPSDAWASDAWASDVWASDAWAADVFVLGGCSFGRRAFGRLTVGRGRVVRAA